MREPLSIRSRNNDKVKAVASLKESKYRRQSGLFIVEGSHEINVALQYGYKIESVFIRDNVDCGSLFEKLNEGVATYSVPEAVFQKLSSRQHPDGFLCVCEQQPVPKITAMPEDESTVLILDGVEKPGNYGAILRSAAAFGINSVVLCSEHFDLYNPQVIRNSRAHSLSFRHYADEPDAICKWLVHNKYESFVASPDSKDAIQDVRFGEKTAIILGSEHDGVSEFWRQRSDQSFCIPMTGQVDSLNVSVSASIVLYEVFKQKMNLKP